MQDMWSPWHGCKKISPGCLNCYVYYLDKTYSKDASIITKSKTNFNLPLKKDRQGNFKIPSATILKTCFTSDFFLEEADEWRTSAWEIIRKRNDVTFLIATKRVHRIKNCLPDDWDEGYENVVIAATCENQIQADLRMPEFLNLPIKHKCVFVAPILEYVNLKPYLSEQIELVSVSGESYKNARPCNFEWVKQIYQDCQEANVTFDFHQTGSNFLMNGKLYKINHHQEYEQAKRGLVYLQHNNKK